MTSNVSVSRTCWIVCTLYVYNFISKMKYKVSDREVNSEALSSETRQGRTLAGHHIPDVEKMKGKVKKKKSHLDIYISISDISFMFWKF